MINTMQLVAALAVMAILIGVALSAPVKFSAIQPMGPYGTVLVYHRCPSGDFCELFLRHDGPQVGAERLINEMTYQNLLPSEKQLWHQHPCPVTSRKRTIGPAQPMIGPCGTYGKILWLGP